MLRHSRLEASRAETLNRNPSRAFGFRLTAFFPDLVFGREQFNSTGGTSTHIAASFTDARLTNKAEPQPTRGVNRDSCSLVCK